MSEYDWHPVVALRWSVAGNLQQHWKRRVSNKRGIWYDEYEWRDVPRQSVDEIPVFPYPAQETGSARMQELNAKFAGRERIGDQGELTPRMSEQETGCNCPPSRTTAHLPECPSLNREV